MSSSVMQEIRRKLPIRPRKDAISLTPTELPTTAEQSGMVYELPIDDIIPNRSQPRSCFNQNAILRLSDSIRRYGILQPLTVRKILVPAKTRSNFSPITLDDPKNEEKSAGADPSSTYLPPAMGVHSYSSDPAAPSGGQPTVLYELIAGERRLRAAKLAELITVPCIIVNTDDSTSAELAIIENLLREDLNMFEQAEAFRRLIDEFMLTQDEVARRVSLSQSAVANKLRILRLSRSEREIILQAGLTERHARALLKITDEHLRLETLHHIIDKRMNVSTTEGYIDEILDHLSRERNRAKETTAYASESTIQSDPLSPQPPSAHENSSAELPVASPLFGVTSVSRRKGAIRDIRLFYNSIRNAATILEQTGVQVDIDQQESDEEILIFVHVTTQKPSKPI
ncbi:MAG: ParB/RepB/Spo0J family partition protein [Clostridia bacterium]|nr:ParB/RepB/Spo0J family partition protein [Clostridia bacterium]